MVFLEYIKKILQIIDVIEIKLKYRKVVLPMPNTTKIPNRLINEKSPYLQQHAYNPVNWFPWCEEAFEKAKQEDKPVFLSVGYS